MVVEQTKNQLDLKHNEFVCESEKCCISWDSVWNREYSLRVDMKEECMNGEVEVKEKERSGYYLPKLCHL